MEFFKRYFSSVSFDREQTKVRCPFHKDDNPSATINTEKSLFYCPVCGDGYNEVGFVAKVNDISLIEATKVISKLEGTATTDWGLIERAELWGDSEFLSEVKKLISEETIEKLNLGMTLKHDKKFLGIPIFYNGVLMDVKHYNILKHSKLPKMYGTRGGENGYVFPYDLWKKDDRKTYIMEGEKDAMVARDFGLNAITFTGGASSLPNKMVLNSFKGKEVVLVYDNDDSGRKGMVRVYDKLIKVASSVKYIDISQIVPDDKGDFADAVFNRGMDLFTFELLLEEEFTEDEVHVDKNYISIKDALVRNMINKEIKSIVNVSAEFSDMFALPIIAEVEKVAITQRESNNLLSMGTKFTWYFDTDKHLKQLFSLIEYNAKEEDIKEKIKQFVGVPKSEQGVRVTIKQTETVYKYQVMDANSRLVVNEHEDGINNTIIDLYTFVKMNIGVEYEIDHVLLPHTFRNQKIMSIARNTEELDLGKDFRIDKGMLDVFRTEGTVAERVDLLFQSSKHHIAKHLDYNMWLMSDLTMNSILEIDYGTRTWGALDIFILGDTSTGKSEVTKGLVELYDFGHFLSLKTATPIGLIGGSKKDGDSMVNTIGAIPRQHKKLVVMEEFSGAPASFISTMTDIRTTRRVHIIRVSGELNVACNLRMITISNPLGDDSGMPKFLSAFPNGILPLMELINNPEDVGRYDGFILMPQIRERFNPFTHPLQGKAIPKENYEYKAKWVYTREPENVKFDDGVEAYIWEQSEILNDRFESNFPLFGTKAAIKLARFSVALASQIVNVDETYENIIVTKEIVDFIMEYFFTIYDNHLFKLHDYKKDYDSYNEASKEDIKELQELYPKNSNVIEFLQGTSTTSLDSLRANSGLDMKDFNVLYNKLAQLKFIRSLGRRIVPTTKLRMALNQIDKTFTTSAGMSRTVDTSTFKIEEE